VREREKFSPIFGCTDIKFKPEIKLKLIYITNYNKRTDIEKIVLDAYFNENELSGMKRKLKGSKCLPCALNAEINAQYASNSN
jgi:hypothetical protein